MRFGGERRLGGELINASFFARVSTYGITPLQRLEGGDAERSRSSSSALAPERSGALQSAVDLAICSLTQKTSKRQYDTYI
jgi:hypothetical protein